MDPSPHNDPELRSLLQSAFPPPALPPRFEQSVWRRIAATRAPERSSFIDQLLAFFLQPRWAATAAIVLLAAGTLAGARESRAQTLRADQARYFSIINPLSHPGAQ